MAATDERQALVRLGEEQGWTHRESDRADVYTRGTSRVRVIWQGNSAISGASQYHDEILGSYTRELGTVRTWLMR